MSELENKVVLVTGAAAGIGLATANAFAAAGAKVALADRDEKVAEEHAARLRASGRQAVGMRVDVASEGEVSALMARIVETWGRLDIAFNNAGVISQMSNTADIAIEEWDRVLNVNLRGTFLCMRAELQTMLKQGEGIIVNCASIGALRGVAGLPAYTASKHGVLGLTKTAALEYCRRGIRINAVCPGQIDTPMNDRLTGGDKLKTDAMIEATQPIGRLGTPDEIAAGVLWLASPAASFMVGHALSVDGGQNAR